MYNEIDQEQIRRYERQCFKELKLEENKNKLNINDNIDILYTKDYILQDYSNNGDSGKLLLAVNKNNNLEKYIVKHVYYNSACNEYMYSKVANKLGILTPQVKLFINNSNSNKLASDFVCGIEYLDSIKQVKYNDLINNIEYVKTYYKMVILELIFDQSDGIEYYEYNNKLYQLDNAETFGLDFYDISPLAYNFNKNGINIREFTIKRLMKKINNPMVNRVEWWSKRFEQLSDKYGEVFNHCLDEIISDFMNITDEEMNEWIETVTIIYPDAIGEYYLNYFKTLKLDLNSIIENIKTR